MRNYEAILTAGGARADFVNIWHQEWYFSFEKMRQKLFSGDRIVNYDQIIITDAADTRVN
jgi:hypothetical protein